MRTKVLFSILVLFSLLASCNMPAGQITITQPTENQPVSFDANAMATAVELTAIARVTQLAGSAVPATPASTVIPTATSTATSTPTTVAPAGPCSPTVTATVIANVRSGPDTAYDIVGSLSLGQTATIVGRNDAYTWWYIDYPGVAGNHAWIAGSVVTASCIPAVVQVVAAPPLPATTTATQVALNPLQPLQPLQPINPNVLNAFKPDLVIVNMEVPPNVLLGAHIDVKVKVKNQGASDAGSFTVQWWAGAQVGCSWPVASLAAGASVTKTCSYAFPNTGDYTVKAVADSGATVGEKNESNNTSQETVQVIKLIPLKKIPLPLNQP